MIASVVSLLTAFGFLISAIPGGFFQQSFSRDNKGYPDVALFQSAKVLNQGAERRLHVEHEGKWYDVVSIGDISSKEMFDFADKNIKTADVNKRLIEDLPVVFQMMKKPLTIPTLVKLRSPDGKVISEKIIASKENRSLIKNGKPKKSQRRARRPSFSTSDEKVALFSDAKVKTESGKRQLHVLHEGQWYRVKSIDGTTIEALFEFADNNIKQKSVNSRLIEDLPIVFEMMRKPLETPTSVLLESTKNGKLTKIRVTATERKRSRLKQNRRNLKLDFSSMEADVRAFQKGLEGRFSYLTTNGVDLKAECDALLKKHSNGITAPKLAAELQIVLSKFIDGHSGVSGPSKKESNQRLPFLIEPIGDRFVAFFSNRDSFVEENYPYLNKIDGIPVKQFIAPLKAMIPTGSPQYILRQKLRLVRDLGNVRKLLGVKSSDEVVVELANEAGDTKQAKLSVGERRPIYGRWPINKTSQIFKNNIGYLRIDSMNGDAAKLIRADMPKFKDTDGLIIDVRDNGGGTREALIELAGHLLGPDDQPRIANVCKYRLFDQHKTDHLESRYAYRVDSPQFNETQRKAIREFSKSFKPEWEPEKSKFSDWHFLVLGNDKFDARPQYNKPVVILMNQKCFSATDIFLGGLKGFPNVTLVGQPSSGGSARRAGFGLPNSKCNISCATMASFQPNGKLYDGNGIMPDILVQPTPQYFLRGGGDPFLDKAFEVIKAGK